MRGREPHSILFRPCRKPHRSLPARPCSRAVMERVRESWLAGVDVCLTRAAAPRDRGMPSQGPRASETRPAEP